MPSPRPDPWFYPPKPNDALEFLFGGHSAKLSIVNAGVDELLRLDRLRRHLLLTVLDHVEDLLSPISLGLLSDRFRADTGLAVLEVAKVYRRLGAAPLRVGRYRSLADALRQHPAASRMATHVETLTPDIVDIFLTLPPQLRRSQFMETVQTAERAEAIRRLCEIAVRLGRNERDLFAALLAAEDLVAIERILGKAVTPVRLARGPDPSDSRLVQVVEVKEIKELGRTFENCLAHMATRMARSGDNHLYVWNGEETCLVSVVRDGPYGYRLDQIAGPQNQRVSGLTEKEILAAFDGSIERRASVWELLNDV